MRKLKSLFAVIMAMAMMFAMSSVAFAATSYPNLTSYETDYTYTVTQGEEDYVLLQVVPATDAYVAGTFTKAEAEAVTWAPVAGSPAGVQVFEIDGVQDKGAMEISGDTYSAYATIQIAADAEAGTASILATNPATGATMNFTIVVEPATPAAPVSNIGYEVYTDNTTLAFKGTLASVAANNHYGNTNFPSVLDVVMPMQTANASKFTAYNIANSWGSYVLQSMTINKMVYVNYTAEDGNSYGWQYRVIRNGEVLPLSAIVGMDDFALQAGDTVVLKYGVYGAVDFE